MLVDTHCHIHWSDYPIDAHEVISHAHSSGVRQIICVGTDIDDSKLAVEYASKYDGVFVSVGVHPHYAEDGIGELENLVSVALDSAPNNVSKLVAIGEIGLDYYKNSSSREAQKKILCQQIKIALKYDLPIIFHVRDAYDDFWSIVDSFPGVRGVLHCFTDTVENAQKGIDRGLYLGVNGISTFTKDEKQLAMFLSLPLHKILLETDSPLLTPSPFRGKIKVNEPAFVREIAEHCGAIHQISFEEVAKITTANASTLFKL